MIRFIVLCILLTPSVSLAMDPPDIREGDLRVCAEWLTRNGSLPEAKTVETTAMIVVADDTYIRSATEYALLLGQKVSPSGTGAHLIYFVPVSLDELKELRGRTEVIDNSKIEWTAVPGMLWGGFMAGLLQEWHKADVKMHIYAKHDAKLYTFSYSNVKFIF